jgi:transcriptional regulator GlxA family with amidase domain
MESRLSEADPDAIPDLLSAWVRERLLPPADGRDKGMSGLVSSMEQANMQGGTSVRDWAEETGWSKRQLERKFKEGVGMTPKQWQQIHRFNSARRMILRDPDVDLLDVIHRCGYYDYAHFSKDFDRFYEMTPKAFQQWVKDSRQKFADPDRVVFLQDSED